MRNVFLTSHLQKTMRSRGAYLSAHLARIAIVVILEMEKEERRGGSATLVVELL